MANMGWEGAEEKRCNDDTQLESNWNMLKQTKFEVFKNKPI